MADSGAQDPLNPVCVGTILSSVENVITLVLLFWRTFIFFLLVACVAYFSGKFLSSYVAIKHSHKSHAYSIYNAWIVGRPQVAIVNIEKESPQLTIVESFEEDRIWGMRADSNLPITMQRIRLPLINSPPLS